MGFFYYRREIAVLPTTTGIEKKREKIDALNEKIVILLAKRTQAAKKIVSVTLQCIIFQI